MTPQEFDKKLRSLSEQELNKFNTDFGGGRLSVEERVQEFVANPQFERRICQLLGLKTEAEKLSESAFESATAAVISAKSAKLSVIFSGIAVLVASCYPYFQFLFCISSIR